MLSGDLELLIGLIVFHEFLHYALPIGYPILLKTQKPTVGRASESLIEALGHVILFQSVQLHSPDIVSDVSVRWGVSGELLDVGEFETNR